MLALVAEKVLSRQQLFWREAFAQIEFQANFYRLDIAGIQTRFLGNKTLWIHNSHGRLLTEVNLHGQAISKQLIQTCLMQSLGYFNSNHMQIFRSSSFGNYWLVLKF